MRVRRVRPRWMCGAVISCCWLVLTTLPLPGQCVSNLTSTGNPPLMDLGTAPYLAGFVGGLYPDGSNVRPPAHLAAGLAIAANEIVPRDATGAVDVANGLIGMISVGMSNTTQEFSGGPDTFLPRANADPARNPQLVIVDGAQGGQAAEDWAGGTVPWAELASRLAAAGVAPPQVQVVWMKLANRQPNSLGAFPLHAQSLASDLATVAQTLRTTYPNLRLAFVSSRTRSYTNVPTALNPEPFAYESGFAVRWLIEDQLSGVAGLDYATGQVPWFAWGPYLWIDGENPRSDGAQWFASDLIADCTHPSIAGRVKVADQLIAFFKADPVAVPWFLRPTAPVDAPIVSVTPSATTGEAPLTVTFATTATAANGAWTIDEHAWHFDDGCTSLAASPSKTFHAAGEYAVALTVTDSVGHTTRVTIPITVMPSGTPTAPMITGPVLPLADGAVSSEYAATFTASGSAPINWSIVAGALPPGMSLSGAGSYSGVPVAPGLFTFTVEAANALGSDTVVVMHTIGNAPPGPVVLEPIADTYVRDGAFENANFGSAPELAIRTSQGSGQTARVLLRFDVAAASGVCDSATLRFTPTGVGTGSASVSAIAVDDDSWGETAVTWVTQPALGAVLDTQAVTGAGVEVTLDVTAAALAALSGDGILTLALVGAGIQTPLLMTSSREGTAPAQLEIACGPITGDGAFLRGDCNDDGVRDISDPIVLLEQLFGSGAEANCVDACDANDDGARDIADVVSLLDLLFGQGPPLPVPSANCGFDPTSDAIDCARFSSCGP
ncbi:MAG: DNRLRE domain-containing protein [Planctomycetota bacterium]